MSTPEHNLPPYRSSQADEMDQKRIFGLHALKPSLFQQSRARDSHTRACPFATTGEFLVNPTVWPWRLCIEDVHAALWSGIFACVTGLLSGCTRSSGRSSKLRHSSYELKQPTSLVPKAPSFWSLLNSTKVARRSVDHNDHAVRVTVAQLHIRTSRCPAPLQTTD